MAKILPFEIFTLIFEKLDSPSIGSCKLVCKNWKIYLDNSRFVKEKNILHQVDFYDGNLEAWKDVIIQCPEFIDYLEVILQGHLKKWTEYKN